MPRVQRPELDPVYAAARQFVDAALVTSDSVFTPGDAIWTLENVREFHHLFVEAVDESKNSFNDKLLGQLNSATPACTQLAAELMFFHSLGVSNQGPVSKLAMIEPLLGKTGVAFPKELRPAVQFGVAHHGAGLSHRDAYIRFLARFMLAWKQLDGDERAHTIAGSHALREFVYSIQPDADGAQRNMVMHLIDPEYFEPIALDRAKNDIVSTFHDLVSDSTADVDSQLVEIRQALSGKYGDDFNFYDDDVKRLWGIVADPVLDTSDPVERIRTLAEASYPDADMRQILFGLMARAIARAHTAGPKTWGVTSDPRRLYMNLNVGRLATLRISEREVMVALDFDSLDDSTVAELNESSTRQSKSYASLPASWYWMIASDRLPDLLDRIEPSLLRHIDNAAAAVRVTPYARSHSAPTIDYVASVVGHDLPFPEHRELPEGSGSGWDGFVNWAARIYDHEQFDGDERDYKLEIGQRLQAARTAVLDGTDDWPDVLQRAFTKGNNLTPWQAHSRFYAWAHEDPDTARSALLEIWNSSFAAPERVTAFLDRVPADVMSGSGTRLAIASFLLMVEPAEYPIFRPSPFREAWRLTGWDGPSSDADEAALYTSALDFMDELRSRLAGIGVEIRDRLDAQGLIWSIGWNNPPAYLPSDDQDRLRRFRTGEPAERPDPTPKDLIAVPKASSSYVEPSFDEIVEHFRSARFRIDEETLLRYHLSLKTRGFVILSGVSGTGKSWLTRLYAEAVGGEFCLVPVAPNWTTNEDLLGYHNPVSDVYVDTELTRFLRSAVAADDEAALSGATSKPYFFVLDEMNLARVEYYLAKFLSVMEARDDASLELSANEKLRLPRNLYAIGTVNVDETTHGFADKVYDRAQVIQLPVTEQDLVAFIGDADYADDLIAIWRAIYDVAPFAYRVVDEIRLYVAAATDEALPWQQALDHQILKKVLPKLARSDDRVGPVLAVLAEICTPSLPLSARKCAEMRKNIEAHGFAAYF